MPGPQPCHYILFNLKPQGRDSSLPHTQRHHPPNGSPVGAAYMPPAHLAYTTNLTHHHSVGAGHARPAGFPLHPVQPKTVGEGFIPPAYPTPSPTQRPTRRGGIHAARAPCLYHQPNHPPPCRGRACPARNLPDTTACGYRTANPQHAPCLKIPLKICRKNQKQPLTIVIHIATIIKLSRGGHAAKSAS